MNRIDLRRYRAERLLRREFLPLRAKVLAVVRSRLRAKGVALDPADLEACYSQAWHGMYAALLGGEQIENPSAWLVLVTFRRAIDESRAIARSSAPSPGVRPPGHAHHAANAGTPGGDPEGASALSDPDLARRLDDRARLRHLFEGMRERLSERECEAASLCYLQGLSRAEAAQRLGISGARMRKLMEGAGPGRPGVAAKVGALLDTISAGDWCEQRSSLIRAYAFGLLDPNGIRHELAVAHCRECPACRAQVAMLRGLAAVLPPLPLRLVSFATAGDGGKARGRSGSRARSRSGRSIGSGAASRARARVGGGAGSRVGFGSGGGWSVGASPLATKFAVGALAIVGVGVGALAIRAHPIPAQRAHAAPRRRSPPVTGPPTRESLHTLAAPAARSRRVPPRTPVRLRSTGAPAATRRTAQRGALLPRATDAAGTRFAPEFTPERAPGEVGATPSSTANAHTSGTSAGTSEFGFE